jgi:hypothetical protein
VTEGLHYISVAPLSEVVGIRYYCTLENAGDHDNSSVNYERGIFLTEEVWILFPLPVFILTLYALDPYIMVPVISLSTHIRHTVKRVA